MTLRSGQLARMAGVNVETLRFYERRGLLVAPSRTLGGHRAYGDDAVARIGVVKAAQRLGFTLAEIADMLGSGRGADSTLGLHDRVLAKLDEIEQQVAELETIRGSLQQLLTARCDSLVGCTRPECPVPRLDPVAHLGA